jgi:hypothetical protein
MMLRWAACCMAAVLLAGCELIKAAEEPVDLYTITPKNTFEADMPAVTWQLSVDLPAAAANDNTRRPKPRPFGDLVRLLLKPHGPTGHQSWSRRGSSIRSRTHARSSR